ncbi:hypothetical protein [Fulvivirga ligni]|uniref:hypothetical protein n=1 Tax=Fulvivirga ligni TaxID=2904246 RepID=UPI001F26C2F5|nr:hypothetical protein [Fulvivirga ligni]UII21678.1 hypothetical protein LVD16_00305 [Fulvivirga ligni]
MDKLIIQKPSLKFMVEISADGNELTFNVNRYIEASHKEEMSFNAQLAKYDAIKYDDKFYNCHKLLHKFINFMQSEIKQETDRSSVKITLRRNRTFGQV